MSTQSENISLWGGRFSGAPSEALTELSRSTHFDWRLARHDIAGSKAHARALAGAGLLSAEDLTTMLDALEAMDADVVSGKLQPLPEDEDVHTALERALIERVGEQVGGRLRAGRSRNDQIAALVLMYLHEQSRLIGACVLDLAQALTDQAAQHQGVAMPGRTHMQHAQPVLLSHHLLAHVHPLLRDVDRLSDWNARSTRSPYGAGALAGSSLGLDSAQVARDLGFEAPCDNSIDATAARDLVAEFSFICAMIAVDLSRLAEEYVIWNTREFSFVTLDDAFSTGSSMMPQKKNPDVAELARGKAGRLIGDLTGLLASLKGLPLAYDRDLQEDKEPVFDQIETLSVLLPAMTGMVSTTTFNTDVMEASAPAGFSLATDIADWLVRQGVPFREAHELAGKCVQECESRGIDLPQLSAQDFASISKHFTPEIEQVLTVKGSIATRNGHGGTAEERVSEQLASVTSDIARYRDALT